jgi:metalloendopeptidase OMA1, mitochondrial
MRRILLRLLPHWRSWLSVSVAAPAILVCIVGCSRPFGGEGPGHREQPLALRPNQELEIGREAFAELLADAQVLGRGTDVDRVERVGRRIARAVEIEPLEREINLHVAEYPFEWEYRVIVSRQINAFCLPGGKIGVFTGLLSLVSNDDQLAAVIAHEVAHAVAHHTSERIARAQSIGRGLSELSFDREQESEADHIGVFLMTFAGYDPQQAVAFWNEMAAARGGQLKIPEILSDHPSDRRRINQLQSWVPMAQSAEAAYEQGRIAPAHR